LYYQQRDVVYKNCNKCEQFFPVASFPDDTRSSDGKKSRCTPCLNIDTKLYRQAHPDRIRESAKRTRRNHIEKARARGRFYSAKRRALYRAAFGKYTQADIIELIVQLHGKCFWCGVKLVQYHIDHIVPLAKGGSNERSNITLACPSCNSKKRDTLPTEWQQRIASNSCRA